MQIKFDKIEALKEAKEKIIDKIQTKNFQYFLMINIYLYWLLWTLILLKVFWII